MTQPPPVTPPGLTPGQPSNPPGWTTPTGSSTPTPAPPAPGTTAPAAAPSGGTGTAAPPIPPQAASPATGAAGATTAPAPATSPARALLAGTDVTFPARTELTAVGRTWVLTRALPLTLPAPTEVDQGPAIPPAAPPSARPPTVTLAGGPPTRLRAGTPVEFAAGTAVEHHDGMLQPLRGPLALHLPTAVLASSSTAVDVVLPPGTHVAPDPAAGRTQPAALEAHTRVGVPVGTVVAPISSHEVRLATGTRLTLHADARLAGGAVAAAGSELELAGAARIKLSTGVPGLGRAIINRALRLSVFRLRYARNLHAVLLHVFPRPAYIQPPHFPSPQPPVQPPSGSAEQRYQLDARLAEYSSLRQESLQAITNRIQVMNFAFTSLTLILAALLASSVPRLLVILVSLLFVPVASKASALVWLGEYQRSQRAGHGIRLMEDGINGLLGGGRTIYWENSLYSESTHMGYPYVATVLFMLSTGVFGECVGGYYATIWFAHGHTVPAVLCALVIFLYSAALEWRFAAFFRLRWIEIRSHSHHA